MAIEVPDIGIQRTPGRVDCNDELKICSYVAQNVTSRDLISKLNSNLFPGSILSPSEGYLTADGIKKINFYINNEAMRLKFISAIPLMDTLEDFDPSDLVLLTTDIFSLTDIGLTNIQASLVNANFSSSEIANWAISSAFGGPTGLALKLGTNLLSSLLGSNKVKEESSKVTTISQLIPNQAGINFSNTTKVYISPSSSGVVKEEQAGLTIGGTVSISARDNDLVVIKDYNLSYGVVEAGGQNEKVNILSIMNPQLYLVKGTSSLLVSSLTVETSSKTTQSSVSFGKIKEKIQNKIMIITRAESINFKDFVNEMKKTRMVELHQQFSEEEKAKLPSSEIDLKSVLGNIIPLAYFTTSGDRVLGFKLDPKDARLDNISKNIEISVTSGGMFSRGLKQKIILLLENLMLSGLKFDPLTPKELKKSSVDIKLSLKEHSGSAATEKTLHYNPETNKFFE
jgi:hypothetical protein